MKARLIWWLPLLLYACGNAGDPCVTDNDCFAGEVCRDSICQAPLTMIDIDGGRPPDGAAAPSDGGSDASHDHDAGQDPNNGVADAGGDIGVDLSSTEDAAEMQACVVDPFIQCVDDEDPDNNSFPGVAFAPMTRGCQPSGFVPLDETISGRQCALDPEDQYYLTIVECDADEPGMVIEATLDVKDDCDPALIWFDVESIGTSCADPNPDSDKTLRCETLATGERRISVIWPGDSNPSVGSIRFSIQTPDRQDVQFDYDLRIVVREP